MGGVLFIDEVYVLFISWGGSDFGDEVIQILFKCMEDYWGWFFVFVAGYLDNMEVFLKANFGLNFCFDKIFKFEDYNLKELYCIVL